MVEVAELSGTSTKRAQLLGGVPLFRRMRPQDLATLAARVQERPMRSGEVLFRRGDIGSSVLVILAGQVRIVLPGSEGREQVLRVLPPGEVLGELALLDGGCRTADAVADTNGNLLVVERRDLMPMLRADPDLSLAILAVLCGRLRATDWLLEAMLFHDSTARLASTLLMLSQHRPAGQVNMTQAALSERVGAARETVNKKLREWQADKILTIQPGRITVVDKVALRRHAPPIDFPNGELPQLW